MLAATVYTLWMERNQRIFQQKALSRDQLVLRTVSCIREALSLKRDVIQSQVNRDLRSSWGLSARIFSYNIVGSGCIAFPFLILFPVGLGLWLLKHRFWAVKSCGSCA